MTESEDARLLVVEPQDYNSTAPVAVIQSNASPIPTTCPDDDDENYGCLVICQGLLGTLLGRWNTILIAVFVSFYCDFALNSMGVPIFPMFLASLQVPRQQIGVLFACKPAAQLLSNTVSGPLVGRFGAQRMLLAGLGVLALSTATFGVGLTQAANARVAYGLLLGARCIHGLASAFIMTAGMSWIAQTHAGPRRGMVMSVVLVGIGAGAMSGASLAGVLSTLIGSSSLFDLMAGLLLLNSLLILSIKVLRTEKAPADGGAATLASVGAERASLLMDPDILCVIALLFVGNFGMTLLQPTLPIYVHLVLGFNQSGQGLTWGAMAFVYLMSKPLSGVLAERAGKWKVISGGVLLMALGLFLLGFAPGLAVLLLSICAVGVGVAFITTPCMPLLADIANRRSSQRYGVVYSTADMATSLGMIAGPLAGSFLSGWVSLPATFQTMGALSLLSIFCSTSLRNVR